MKENTPACLSCGRALETHGGLQSTCAKLQQLRRHANHLIGSLKGKASDSGEMIAIAALRRALEETA